MSPPFLALFPAPLARRASVLVAPDDAAMTAVTAPAAEPPTDNATDTGSLKIRALAYAYPGGESILNDVTLDLPPGSRCLLSGANGAGKSTLLQILAGKTMVDRDAVRVIGKPPFHEIELTWGTSGRSGVAPSAARCVRRDSSPAAHSPKRRRVEQRFLAPSLPSPSPELPPTPSSTTRGAPSRSRATSPRAR